MRDGKSHVGTRLRQGTSLWHDGIVGDLGLLLCKEDFTWRGRRGWYSWLGCDMGVLRVAFAAVVDDKRCFGV